MREFEVRLHRVERDLDALIRRINDVGKSQRAVKNQTAGAAGDLTGFSPASSAEYWCCPNTVHPATFSVDFEHWWSTPQSGHSSLPPGIVNNEIQYNTYVFNQWIAYEGTPYAVPLREWWKTAPLGDTWLTNPFITHLTPVPGYYWNSAYWYIRCEPLYDDYDVFLGNAWKWFLWAGRPQFLMGQVLSSLSPDIEFESNVPEGVALPGQSYGYEFKRIRYSLSAPGTPL